MSLPSNFVKQIYDIAKPKGYALSDSFFVDKLYEIIKEYKITKVVEAGTYQGRSTVELSYLVDEVIGIELVEKYIDITTKRMIENSRTNYRIFRGSSPEVLPQIISEVDPDHTLFFLDAHCSAAGGGFQQDGYWPIRDEIRALPKNKGIIIVHDIHVPIWGDLGLHDPQRLGYDTYIVDSKRQRFDYGFIKNALTDWSPTHRIEYNSGDKTSGDQRGVGFIYPTNN